MQALFSCYSCGNFYLLATRCGNDAGTPLTVTNRSMTSSTSARCPGRQVPERIGQTTLFAFTFIEPGRQPSAADDGFRRRSAPWRAWP
jgi:hypothetical protein